MHVHAKIAFQSGVQMRINGLDLLLLSLRLPFGGSPCPSEFCLLSDIITDIINDLLECDDWDPEKVHSKYVSSIPAPSSLPPNIPFGKAIFIDDIITVGLISKTIWKELQQHPAQ